MRRQSWETPESLRIELNAEFGFLDDPCPIAATDGLLRDWNKAVFVNPPFCEIEAWLDKARREIASGRTALAVFLLPARTDRPWFHDIVLKEAEIRWIRGRVRFSGVTTNPPFACFLAIFAAAE